LAYLKPYVNRVLEGPKRANAIAEELLRDEKALILLLHAIQKAVLELKEEDVIEVFKFLHGRFGTANIDVEEALDVILEHEVPLLKEHELELEYKGVKTRIDEYEDGILVEKKFVNFVPRTREELAKYYSHYVKQVEYEALFLTANGREIRKAFLLFVKRGEPEEGRPPLIAFEVPIDLNAITARFEEELARLKDVLASGVPPEIPKDYGPFDYPCTYYKYSLGAMAHDISSILSTEDRRVAFKESRTASTTTPTIPTTSSAHHKQAEALQVEVL
jgi:hypothetical protein